MAVYKNDSFLSNDSKKVLDFIETHSFASLISAHNDNIQHITKAPLLLKKIKNDLYLEGHLARANPHINFLKENTNVSVLFDGPHGYISPTWYQNPEKNVPTWNYSTVVARGEAKVISSPDHILESVLELSRYFEENDFWEKTVDMDYIKTILPGILSVQIKILEIENQFKLSQNRNAEDRENLIKKTPNLLLAEIMKKF